jgi:hypothetical protein
MQVQLVVGQHLFIVLIKQNTAKVDPQTDSVFELTAMSSPPNMNAAEQRSDTNPTDPAMLKTIVTRAAKKPK